MSYVLIKESYVKKFDIPLSQAIKEAQEMILNGEAAASEIKIAKELNIEISVNINATNEQKK